MKKLPTLILIFGTVFLAILIFVSLPTAIWQVEKTDILQQAQGFVKNNSVSGLKFEVHFKKRVGDWVYLQAFAINQKLDPLGIIFHKTNQRWAPYDMGTTFPELEEKMPQLFTD